MNVITKFSALGLAAVLFAACSDSSSDNGKGDVTPEITGIGLTTTGGSTVTNYKVGNVAKAMRKASAVSMPADDKTPSDAIDITTVSDFRGVSGNLVVKKSSKEFTIPQNVNLGACNIYVEAGATLNIGETTFNELHIQQGATVNHTGETVSGVVVNYGTFNQEKDKTLRILSHNFYTNSNLSLQKTNNKLYVSNATLYVKGSLRATYVELQTANIEVTGNVDMEGANYVSRNSSANIGGYFVADKIDIAGSGNATTSVDKYVWVKKSLSLGDDANLVTNSLDASSLKDSEGNLVGKITTYIAGNAKILVRNAGYLTFDEFTTDDKAHIQINENAGVACFKAREFSCKSETVKTFSTPSEGATFLLELPKMTLNGKETDFDDAVIDASYYDYADAQSKDGIEEVFNKEYGYTLNKTDFTALPKLDLISTVQNNANDYMSATCIAPFNNNLYVSYHTRGTQHGASLEVFKVNGNQVSVTQTLKDNDNALDFNHCMVDNSKLYLAGSHINAGAGFGYINIKTDGTLNTDRVTIDGKTREPLQFVSIDEKASTSKVDANSTVMFQGNVFVATTAGFSIFEPDGDSWKSIYTTSTPGKAKSLAVYNNRIYGLFFNANTSDDTTPVGGTISWTENKSVFNTGTSTYSIGDVAPTNGKNTIAVDATNGDVYACRGQYGVKQCTVAGGGNGWNWDAPKNKKGNYKGYANGVAVDAKYVYVACGGYGLVIIDKATGKELCHRTVGGSANYVAVNNGYIYVANGLNRVQVFKLNYTAK